ncbi:MAG: histone-like nucleoid-structuring protein Lsr2 [Nocardioidaceae bacterium]
MAQKINVVLVDDMDGSGADETVSFGLDGTEYEIDLSQVNAAELRAALAPYVDAGRKVGGRRRRSQRPSGGPSPSEIRQWARENGWDVPERGRVSAEVREAYAAAH